jgi:hypothetical protein
MSDEVDSGSIAGSIVSNTISVGMDPVRVSKSGNKIVSWDAGEDEN